MKKRILVITGMFIVVAIGLSFGYYLANITFSGDGAKTNVETATVGDTSVSIEGLLEFEDVGILPGHKNISKIKVTATGDQNVLYNVIWTGQNSLNTTLYYTIYKSNTNINPSITKTIPHIKLLVFINNFTS